MPFPFLVILIVGATGLFLTAVLFLLVRKMPRTEPGAGWWAVSSLAAGLGYVMLLVLASNGRPADGEAVYNILFVIWAMALYIGGRRFLKHKAFETPIFLLSGAMGLWLVFFYFVSPGFLPAAIGISVFCGALNLHLGWLWARHSEELSPVHYLLIGSLWVSGLHWLDYPILRPVEWFAPIGFTICSVVSVVVNGTLAGLLLNQFRTRMENAERALRNARDEADLANRAKSTFLANMSHELRTPLNAIIGFAEVMALETFGPSSEKYKEYAHLINGSGKHLLKVINGILDMAKIEAGKVELATEETDMKEIIAEVVFMLGGQANDGNVTFLSEVGPTHTLKVDPLRIKQALVNVTSNALKFTPGGTVTLSVTCNDRSHNLIVSDTGIGMTEEDIELALKPFSQAEGHAYTRRFEGTGLGLPLARQLVELHGGSLDIESEPGVGTTVTMSFPRELCQRSEVR